MIQEERGKKGGFDDGRLTERVEVLGPALSLATLRNAVLTACVEHLGDSWDLRFGELAVYKEIHGDCNVSQHDKDNAQLGKWVNKQRQRYQSYRIQRHRVL